MYINNGYFMTVANQPVSFTPKRAEYPTKPISEETHTNKTEPRRVDFGSRSRFMTYNLQNQQTVRIVFGDGSVLVGTFYDKIA